MGDNVTDSLLHLVRISKFIAFTFGCDGINSTGVKLSIDTLDFFKYKGKCII